MKKIGFFGLGIKEKAIKMGHWHLNHSSLILNFES
jgi:hypothetical protein